MIVFGPLLHIKNENLPRGVRKAETLLRQSDLRDLLATIPSYEATSLLHTLKKAVELYRELRKSLYMENVLIHELTERKVMEYFDNIERSSGSVAVPGNG